MENSKDKNDHYISQTYLKKFKNENGKLWTYDKKYLGMKERATKSICHESGGSQNHYFPNSNVIEDFLKPLENQWSISVDTISKVGNCSLESFINAKWIISGYLAYLRFSPPSVAKTGQQFLAATVKDTLKILKKNGELPPPPSGFEYLMDDIENQIQVEVDPKFHQAMAITALEPLINTFFNSPWLILVNNNSEPFITSDNPACMWYPQPDHIESGKIYLALTPKIGVLVDTFKRDKNNKYDQSYNQSAEAMAHFVTEINTYLVKCASNIVVSNISSDRIMSMVTEFKDWEYSRITNSIPTPTGIIRNDVWRPMKKNNQ
jgi:hypothetical protein